MWEFRKRWFQSFHPFRFWWQKERERERKREEPGTRIGPVVTKYLKKRWCEFQCSLFAYTSDAIRTSWWAGTWAEELKDDEGAAATTSAAALLTLRVGSAAVRCRAVCARLALWPAIPTRPPATKGADPLWSIWSASLGPPYCRATPNCPHPNWLLRLLRPVDSDSRCCCCCCSDCCPQTSHLIQLSIN